MSRCPIGTLLTVKVLKSSEDQSLGSAFGSLRERDRILDLPGIRFDRGEDQETNDLRNR